MRCEDCEGPCSEQPMTPARQPHPQRCETCENKSCEYWEIHPHMSARHDQDTGWTASPGVITFAVGCATHTSAPAPEPDADCHSCKFGDLCRPLSYIPPCYNHGPDSPAAAAKAAREQFIDEAITECEWDGPITQEDVWGKLESLRAQQESKPAKAAANSSKE